jgi:penicillin-binding protein 2
MMMKFRKKRKSEIDPDEIFMDSHNLPQFDDNQFEGRIEKPISMGTQYAVLFVFIVVLMIFGSRIFYFQVSKGEIYAQRSENNRLRHSPIFAVRGIIYDRNGVELAWNEPSEDPDFFIRKYTREPGMAHVVGYVQYPKKDSSGFYAQEDFVGVDGAEKYFNSELHGENGVKLVEVNALGKVQANNVVEPPVEGKSVYLSIDSRVQSEMYRAIKDIAERVGFDGGAGVIIDTKTGEVIAMTSYPEFDPEVMSDKKDTNRVKEYLTSKSRPFINRAVEGLYTPGSVVKPFMSLAALNEKIIDPSKQIQSTGSISVQNQYNPKLQTIFRDWKAHGWVDMRHAIAVSSDVYFYAIGGGYKDQTGLGIARIEKYMKLFGFGSKIQNDFFTGPNGTVPNPEWKKLNFNGEVWTLGNTYHTSIGQYGFQTSVIQMARAIASIVNNGLLRDPSILKDTPGSVVRQIEIPESAFKIVEEGMRLAVTEGTGKSLNVKYVEMAAKSGTAELGVAKDNVNSWMTGFFPYSKPRYAFAVLMERGSVHNLIGAGAAMRETIDWMSVNTPEYFQ